MKKMFKGLAVLAATAALGTGVAFAAACGGGNDGDGGDEVAKVVNYSITTKSANDVKEVVGASSWRPGVFVINVSVDGDGKILYYEVETNGTTTQWQAHPDEEFLAGTWFVGKTAADITSVFGNDIAYTDVQATLALEGNDLTAGASQTNFIYLHVAAFASANADDVIGGATLASLTEYADVIDLANSSATVVDEDDFVVPTPVVKAKVANYTITTKSANDVKEVVGASGWRPGVFVINVSVDEDGKILSYEVETNGTTTQWQAHPDEEFLAGAWFVGKTAADIASVFGNDIAYTDVQTTLNLEGNDLTGGASQTNFIYLHVAAFASANADAVIGGATLASLTEYASVIDLALSTVEVVEVD